MMDFHLRLDQAIEEGWKEDPLYTGLDHLKTGAKAAKRGLTKLGGHLKTGAKAGAKALHRGALDLKDKATTKRTRPIFQSTQLNSALRTAWGTDKFNVWYDALAGMDAAAREKEVKPLLMHTARKLKRDAREAKRKALEIADAIRKLRASKRAVKLKEQLSAETHKYQSAVSAYHVVQKDPAKLMDEFPERLSIASHAKNAAVGAATAVGGAAVGAGAAALKHGGHLVKPATKHAVAGLKKSGGKLATALGHLAAVPRRVAQQYGSQTNLAGERPRRGGRP